MKRLPTLIFLMCLVGTAVICEAQEITTQQRNMVAELQKTGALRMEWEYHAAYFDPRLWGQIDYQTKEGFALSLAILCKEKNKPHGQQWVEIFDLMTGKKLAKYSVWGFKVY